MISKEELVNNYANKYLNKTLQLNSLPSYNSSSNHALNATIKDAPSNLLGVYFDGGTRENKDNYYTLVDLKKMSHNVSNVYLFYDNTIYNDVIMEVKIDKNFYFEKHKEHWEVPSEWRNWWWNYERWRDHWYNKKTPTEKGYYLVKYGSQGFKLEIKINEKETIEFILEHAVGIVLDQDFHKVKAITENGLKTYLGDGIFVDYNKPLLTFKTNNWVNDVWDVSHKVVSVIPVVGLTVDLSLGVFDIFEGAYQENLQQVINGAIDTAFVFMPVPGLDKVAGSKTIKVFSKKLPKLLQKEIFKQTTKNVVESAIKDPLQAVVKEKVEMKFSFQPINIKLDEYTNFITKPINELVYEFESNEQIHIINHLGEEKK